MAEVDRQLGERRQFLAFPSHQADWLRRFRGQQTGHEVIATQGVPLAETVGALGERRNWEAYLLAEFLN